MTDNDLMPWGKHKGEKLANVPPEYFLWLKTQIKPIAPNKRSLDQSLLMKYIDENYEVFLHELKQKK